MPCPADRGVGQRPAFVSRFVTYAFYPLLLAATLGLYVSSLTWHWDLAKVFMVLAGVRFVLLLTTEFLFPVRPEWKMTWRSFKRDLKYMAVNGGTAWVLTLGAAWLALDLSRFKTGIVGGLPIAMEVIALLLSFEFFQYWYLVFAAMAWMRSALMSGVREALERRSNCQSATKPSRNATGPSPQPRPGRGFGRSEPVAP